MGNEPVADRELDASTLEGCRHGDPEAQRRLFLCYKDRVFSLALHFLKGDRDVAEDIAQEVFVKVFRALPSFRRDARFSTWLHRIVANACMDELRRRRRLLFFGDLPDRMDGAMAPDGAAEVDGNIKAAVGRLSPKLRITVLLRYFEDLTYAEIAEALDVTQGTVASRLSRAHKVLARELAHLKRGHTPS